MLKRAARYYCLLLLLLVVIDNGYAQAGLGAPVYNQNFGYGNEDPNTIGKPLPSGQSYYSFSPTTCPPPGSYTIVRRMNIKGCFADEWIPLSYDNTNHAQLGNMMLVNNQYSPDSRIVYVDTVNKLLCPGSPYQFSISLIDVDRPQNCSPINDFPSFGLQIEDESGNIVAADTVQIGYAIFSMGQYIYNEYAMNFTMPPIAGRLVVKIVVLRSTVDCAEDFALDDIMIRPIGPTAKIDFNNNPYGNIVKSVCFQDNAVIPMSGNMTAYYPNPRLQWQQSIDDGANWTDIPGATTQNYTPTFSVPDTFLIRLSGSDASTIANPNCRIVSNVVQVQVDGIPANFKISSNSPVCAGNDLQFKAEGGAKYVWSGPNGFADDIPYPHIYNSVLADSGRYYVDVVSAGGCRARDSLRVVMIGTDVHAGRDTSICKGKTVQLQASAGKSYSWTPGTGLSSPSVRSPKATPDVTTRYTVEVKDDFGCTGSDAVTINVTNKVAIKAGIMGPEILCRAYDSATFKDISQGKPGYYQWSFGNNQVSTEVNPPMQFYNIGVNDQSYVVRLAVGDSTGCTDTAYHFLKVADNCYIAVPTAFTPNGDGLNDYLYPVNAYKATNLVFRVYTRNGQIIFETKDWTRKWNGTVKGITQATGVYVWTLEYTDERSKRIYLKGTSVLIR